LHGMLYMQFFVSSVSFLGLVFMSILCSVVHDLNAVRIPNIFPILLIFSDTLWCLVWFPD
jgi:hypothetical protein